LRYIKNNLVGNEKVLYSAELHWFIFIPGILLILLSLLIKKFLVFFLILGIYSLIRAFVLKTSTELLITSTKVIAKTGFIRRESIELNHSKVESFSVNQSIFGRIFNFGSITIQGTGGGKAPITNITNPMKFREKSMSIIEEKKSKIKE
jgi:uncharacterized membrane protein YdbT with pleckstrin-like domain